MLRCAYAAMLLSLLAGCGPQSERERYTRKIVEEYGGLTALEAAADPLLRAEFARVVAEAGTPRQLCRAPIPVEQNAAVVLRTVLQPDKTEKLLTESDPLVAGERLAVAGPMRQRAAEIVSRYAAALANWRSAWQRPACEFELQHTAGYFADTGFIAQVRCGARLEMLAGAVAVDDGNLERAIASVGLVLRGATALADEDHVVCRLEAAQVRREALRLVELIAQHRLATAAHHRALAALLAAQLAAWPAEARVWVGERALGLHAYETIRGGDLAALLTDADVTRLADRRELEHFAAAALRSIDRDELYYLQAMRGVIAACRRPYFARREALRELTGRLARLEGTSEYPLVAGRLLLPGIERAQRAMAADRAACETWHAALVAATGATLPAVMNPLDGATLPLARSGAQVVIALEGDPDDPWPRSIVVPVRAAGDVARTTTQAPK